MRESRIFYIGFSDNDLPMIYVGSVDKQKRKELKMAYCQSCGAQLSDSANFCQSCGCAVSGNYNQSGSSGSSTAKTAATVVGTVAGGLAAEPSDAQTLQTSDDALSQRSERSYGAYGRPQRWAYGRTHGRSQRRTRRSRTGRPQIKNTQSRDQSVSALVVYLKTAGCRRAVLTYNC